MAEGEETQFIKLVSCDIQPNACAFEENLLVHLDFDVLKHIEKAHWEISFVADHMHTRKVIYLGQTESRTMAEGEDSLSYRIETIDISALTRHVVANVGLLSLDLVESDTRLTLVHVGIVTNVHEDNNGVLIRNMFDPVG